MDGKTETHGKFVQNGKPANLCNQCSLFRNTAVKTFILYNYYTYVAVQHHSYNLLSLWPIIKADKQNRD